MNPPSSLDRNELQSNWSKFVQSSAQLAYSRLAKFPPGSGRRLTDLLRIGTDERILEIGCGMGILSSRLLNAEPNLIVFACELDSQYLQTELPEEIRPEHQPKKLQASGYQLPLPDDSIDRVLTHTVANLLNDEEWNRMHAEIRRVLGEGGSVTHLDGVGGHSWVPDSLTPPEGERKRQEQLFSILKEVHEDIESGFVNTIHDLADRFRDSGFTNIQIESYASTFRINNDTWSEDQQKILLELRQRAERDRIQCLRNLTNRLPNYTVEEGDLFRRCISDVQQQALRRRKALENNREIGWNSSTTLAGIADVS